MTGEPVDVSGRPTALPAVDLARFFDPDVVAVVGASDTPGSASAMNYRMLHDWLTPRGVDLRPVNPNRDEVLGRPAHPSLLDVPGEVDVVVILVGADAAERAVADAIAKKAPFAVLFGAGFAESGPEGAERQARVEAMVAGSDLRLLGPNTTLNAFQPFRGDLPGRAIALLTQSGHQGRPIYQAQEIGVRVSHWAPTGNEADLEAADFIRWYADRDEVGAIAAYIEGFKDGRSLMLAADHAAQRGVPVVAIKVGRTEVGRSWAQSHSGHLAGADDVMSAAFRQLGMIRVDTLDELLDTAMLLARAAPPRGDGVAIYSISGGTGAHAADLAAAAGLRLPTLSEGTQARLHTWIAPFLRVSNPIDSGGHPTGDDRGPKILEAILADPDVDVLIVPIAGSFSPISEKFAADLVAAGRTTDKPICVVWGSPVGTEEAYRDILLPSGLPVFRSLGSCLRAVRAYLDHHRFRTGYTSPFAQPVTAPAPGAARARALLAGGGTLAEHRAKDLLDAYGIPVTTDLLCASVDEAVAAAETLGYPVVMKAASGAIAHKSDLGLVRLGVASPAQVRSVFAEMTAVAEAAAGARALDGILVCEQATGGVETILGVVSDELFGPTVVFGIGGVAVEVYRDVTFRVPPFGPAEARRMVGELRGLPLLQGTRGQPAADLDAVVDAIMAVQRLAMDLAGELAELDINPLLARPDGVVALDALAVAASATGG
jgi:acetate---CoA ligase (ADP-forming)